MSERVQRILVPVDLSSCSAAALTFASNLASQLDIKLEVLLVQEPGSDAGRAELHQFVAQTLTGKGAPISERVEAGEVRERIVHIAEQERFDAIVLGTHGRTGRARSLAGSVAESVVRTASCPVVTVRERP